MKKNKNWLEQWINNLDAKNLAFKKYPVILANTLNFVCRNEDITWAVSKKMSEKYAVETKYMNLASDKERILRIAILEMYCKNPYKFKGRKCDMILDSVFFAVKRVVQDADDWLDMGSNSSRKTFYITFNTKWEVRKVSDDGIEKRKKSICIIIKREYMLPDGIDIIEKCIKINPEEVKRLENTAKSILLPCV